jgi:hypothetical protein
MSAVSSPTYVTIKNATHPAAVNGRTSRLRRSTRRLAILTEQVIDRQGRLWAKSRKSAVVPTKSILTAANMPIIGGHHVLALQGPPEGWQATSLLERCREHTRRRQARVQRHVLYLGEINDTQELAWRRIGRYITGAFLTLGSHRAVQSEPRSLSS